MHLNRSCLYQNPFLNNTFVIFSPVNGMNMEVLATMQCSHTKSFLSSVTYQNSKFTSTLSRTTLKDVVGIITGHCQLNKHMTNLKIIADSTCRFCGEAEETGIHIVNDCPGTYRERHEAFELCPNKPAIIKITKFVQCERIKRALLQGNNT